MQSSRPSLFADHVQAILGSWTALSMAVENCLASRDLQHAETKRYDLFCTVVDWFSHGEIFEDELVDLLSSFLEEEFCLIVEDGSCLQVARAIRDVFLVPRAFDPQVYRDGASLGGFRSGKASACDDGSDSSDSDLGSSDEVDDEAAAHSAADDGGSSGTSRMRMLAEEDFQLDASAAAAAGGARGTASQAQVAGTAGEAEDDGWTVVVGSHKKGRRNADRPHKMED